MFASGKQIVWNLLFSGHDGPLQITDSKISRNCDRSTAQLPIITHKPISDAKLNHPALEPQDTSKVLKRVMESIFDEYNDAVTPSLAPIKNQSKDLYTKRMAKDLFKGQMYNGLVNCKVRNERRSRAGSPILPAISPKHTAPVLIDDESDEEYAEYTVHEDHEGIFDEKKVERAKRVTADDADFEGWTKQELDLFNALNDRAVVPMLWVYWKMDFPTLPDNLFTSEKKDALITNWRGNAAAGAKAFNSLIQAGVDARERHRRGYNAAQLLAREFNAYIKWSYRDAKIAKDNYIPLIVVNYALNDEDLETAATRTHERVRKLSDKYRQLWTRQSPKLQGPTPTIFYIFLAKTVMAIGSYDTSAAKPEFRNIFFADWRQKGEDLWNAMAVAILVQQTRSWLVEVDPKKLVGKKAPKVDPDL